MKILSEYSLGDMSVRYVLAEDGQVGMELYPASMKPFIKEGRRYQVDPLVQWKKEGDAFPYGFANGMTMRNSETVSRMEYKEQKVEQSEEGICVTTVLEDALGSEILHILRYKNGDPALWVSTGIRNLGKKPIVLEFLASFSVGGITPLAEDEAVNRLIVHRIRSKWSAEGRLETRTASFRFAVIIRLKRWRIRRKTWCGRPAWHVPQAGRWNSTEEMTRFVCQEESRITILATGARS